MADDKAKHPEETEPTPDEWLELLKRGVGEFNKFRKEHGTWIPHFPRDADLKAASLKRGHLQSANLHRACLQGATLQDACLRQANLARADMARANLRGADLERADLSQATLNEADAKAASFQRARGLESAKLDGLIVDSKTRFWGIETSGIRPRYPVLARAISHAQFVADFERQHRMWGTIWWLLCDCGRNWRQWALWCVFLVVLFAALFIWTGSTFDLAGRTPRRVTYFRLSFVTFTTLGFGEVVPTNVRAEVLRITEAALGFVMVGVLVSTLATKLARRS